MIYRLAMLATVTFWLVMSFLLIRLELRPAQSNILEVPVPYVMRVMFSHGQQSLLSLQGGDHSPGSISLRPYMNREGRPAMDFAGNFMFEMPGGGHQHVSLSGSLTMTKALVAEEYSANVTLREPAFRIDFRGDIPLHTFHYQINNGNHALPARTLPLEAAAILPALFQQLGLETSALPLVQSNLTAPAVEAREARIKLHNEELQVYQLSIRESGAPVADIFVSQLGHVILVKTNFGYTLSSEDFQ